MKVFLLFLILFFSACGSKHNGHVALIPDVETPPSKAYGQDSKEYVRALELAHTLNEANIRPIYLLVENNMMTDDTGNGIGILPVVFRRLTMFAAFDFSPKVKVYTSVGRFTNLLLDPNKRDRAFEIEGIISAFDENREVIDSGIDFGLDFGSGKGSTDVDSQFRNTDKVSSITLDIMFKQNGQMFIARSETLDIKYTNRGYSFGLRINNSGFGISAYHTKKEGIGKTLKRLLHHILHDMIEETVRKKSLTYNPPVKFQ